jgi:hypothetical protein
LIEIKNSDESNQYKLMLDCRSVSKRFHQNTVSTKTRRIFETTLSDQYHLFDQSKAINLSIEMLNWEDMLKDK